MASMRFFILLAIAFSTSAGAVESRGMVVSVHDGDTLTMLVDRLQVRVRLEEIDAPESRQAFGTRSKQSLSEMCFGKEAKLTSSGHDRYGRTIGRITCAGVDANAEQLRRGMAWIYPQYAKDRKLFEIEAHARTARVGLWADAAPVAPWEWRKLNRPQK